MPTRGLNPGTPIVLLGEDDPEDQELVRRAFEQGELDVDLRIVNDGEQLLDYLNGRGRFASAEVVPPDLILIDLNMPRIDGRAVIRSIRSDARFRRTPIVVLSTSSNIDDVNEAYALGCNTYLSKPADLDAFMNAIRELEAYWFRLVRLPRS